MLKKAEMGVGTLIIFIAMLLVAAVAAGVLIQTIGSLQEKSLTTGQQAETQISTNAESIEVSATDGRNGNLTDFQQLMKLSPGSDPVKLDQVLLTFNTNDDTATLKYKGTSGVCQKNNVNGYNTWNAEKLDAVTTTQYTLEEDFDDDGANDYVIITDNENLTIEFRLSTAGNSSYHLSGDLNLSDSSGTAVSLGSSSWTVNDSTTTYATVVLSGTSYTNNTIDANATFVVTPYELGQGYFAAVYEQTGTNQVAGNLQRGDMIRLCYESPGEITEAEEVRINFIPKIGTPTLVQFYTPDVIATERVYLYP